ncbi:19472_t:CDS:2 [Rhizophagus irregularis]|nr:19472_t:CDS:2 [Rhizophagus irregularis]
MEFYRSSMLVLPVDIFAAVDVGAIYRSKEHQRRFGRNGVYTPIKKIAKEWVIVDT